jgi:hypothetical protein
VLQWGFPEVTQFLQLPEMSPGRIRCTLLFLQTVQDVLKSSDDSNRAVAQVKTL